MEIDKFKTRLVNQTCSTQSHLVNKFNCYCKVLYFDVVNFRGFQYWSLKFAVREKYVQLVNFDNVCNIN